MTATDPDGDSAAQIVRGNRDGAGGGVVPAAGRGRRAAGLRARAEPLGRGRRSDGDGDRRRRQRTYEPLTLTLGARAAAAFNSDDLESGNAAKGLTGATGMGTGGWRLAIESETLDIEALAYIRTTDGFVTGMNAVAPREDGALVVPFFNPGSNVDQVEPAAAGEPRDGGSGGDGDRHWTTWASRRVPPVLLDAAGGERLHGGRGANWSRAPASPAARRRTASATVPASGGSRWRRTRGWWR